MVANPTCVPDVLSILTAVATNVAVLKLRATPAVVAKPTCVVVVLSILTAVATNVAVLKFNA